MYDGHSVMGDSHIPYTGLAFNKVFLWIKTVYEASLRVELLFTRDKPCMVFDSRSDQKFFPLNLVAIMFSAKYSAQITVLSGVFVCLFVCLSVFYLFIIDIKTRSVV